jgi:molybdopterin-guanine dinucleotide biosynthesis protein A
MNQNADTAIVRIPTLSGLVLAGGDSRRMGRDKGTLDYRGAPQAIVLSALLAPFCNRVLVAIREEQRGTEPYASMPVIVDTEPRQGPASGLLAAARRDPRAAWLVVAADLALLTAETIAALVHGRRPEFAASAFRNPDGVIEPLCAIWEPAALHELERRAAIGEASPRLCLESIEIALVYCSDPAALVSIDTPDARTAVLGGLLRRGVD